MVRAAQILLCVFAAACHAASNDAFRMTGSVVNDVTGEPVRRASVSLQCQSPQQPGSQLQTATADAGGRFEFQVAVPGRCTLTADRRGFVRKTVAQEASSTLGDVIVRLTPHGVVTGKVVDENGDPMIGVSIQILHSIISMGQRVVRPANNGLTNDLGEYRVAQLPPGRYYVGASVFRGSGMRPSGAIEPGANEDIYARSYYAGASDISNATPLEVAPGAEARADFRMQPAHGFTIRGRIGNAPPGFNGMVTLGTREAADSFNGPGHPVQVDRDTGQFVIKDVTPGRYVINAHIFQGSDHLIASQDVAVANADIEGLVVPAFKGAAISGTVRIDEKGAAAPLDPQRIGIVLRQNESVINAQPAARLRPDKTFVLPDILPGNYVLQVTVQEPYYVQSALYGGVDALTNPIAIASGAVPPALDIAIGSSGGELNGAVMNGDRPASGCSVLLTRRNGAGMPQERIAQADAAGKFVLKAVAPGDYTAYAFADAGQVEYRNPEVLQRFQGENVTLSEGGKQTVQLKLNSEQ